MKGLFCDVLEVAVGNVFLVLMLGDPTVVVLEAVNEIFSPP